LTVVLRSPRFSLSALALVLAALLLASCGGSGKKAATAGSSVPKVSNKEADLKLGAVDVESFGPDVKLTNAQQQAVLNTSQKYLDAAVISPLTGGGVGASYAPLFTPGVQAAATGADQPVLTDAPIGKVKEFTQTASPVGVSALADGTGTVLYLASNFLVNTKAQTDDGPLTDTRTVELTLVPNGSNWNVNAYRVTAVRKLPTGSTTTVASSGGTSK
jgi:hypothetical protein